MKEKIVLASASPRRKELMKQFHLEVTTFHSDIDEAKILKKQLNIEEATKEVALAKALEGQKAHPNALIIGMDTVVVLNGSVLCKPKDRDEARSFLQMLSGTSHTVISGCAVIQGDRHKTCSDTTSVTMYPLSEGQIETYLDTNVWKDKAGGYAIQGPHGALLVQSITGCFFNVMGVPLQKLNSLLRLFGIDLWNHLPRADIV